MFEKKLLKKYCIFTEKSKHQANFNVFLDGLSEVNMNKILEKKKKKVIEK